jgi:Helicase HerA, central domain
MLRKSNSTRAGQPAADHSDTGGKRSWAAMRARLRQGREPMFGVAAVEPPPAVDMAAAPGRDGNRRSGPASSAKHAEPARPHGRSAYEQDSVVAVHEDAAGDDASAAAAPRNSQHEHQATTRAAPPANGADQPIAAAGNGAAHAANSRSTAVQAPRAGAGMKTVSEPAPDTAPGARIGRVISVAGPLVWGMIEEEAASTVEIGAVVRLQGTSARTFGVITTLKNDGRRGGEDDRRMIEIRLLGEILNAGPHRWRFQRGVSSHPALDSAIHAASREELCAIYARPEAPTVRLGTLKHASDLPAFAITDNLLGKHFAVLGTTGAGKSCAVTVILRAILDAHPYGHVIMLDPHNEYHCGFGSRAELLDPSNLKLPYWLLNFEEIAAVLVNQDSPAQAYAEGAILRSAILQARRAYVGHQATEYITVDTPVPYRLSDLVRIINEAMGAFNKPESSAPYQHLINRIEAVSSDKRYEFMFSRLTVHDTMAQVM